MSQNVNVWTANWRRVDTLNSIQFEGDIRIEWTDDNNKQQQHTEKVQTAHLLKALPDEWLMEKYIELAVLGLQRKLGIERDPTLIRLEVDG